MLIFLLIGFILFGCEKESISLRDELKKSFDIQEEEIDDSQKSALKIEAKIETKIRNWLDYKKQK